MMLTGDPRHCDWNDLVVICAGTPWNHRVWPSEKHIATHLSAHTPVLYVDSPSPPLSIFPLAYPEPHEMRIIRPGLAVLSPRALPGLTRPLMRPVTSILVRHAIRRAVQSLGVKRVRALVVAGYTNLLDAIDADQRIVYATDNFVNGAELFGVDRDYLLTEERKQADLADRVVVVTEQLAEHWRALGQDPVLIPNGCDTERFAGTDSAQWPDDVDLPRPIAGVFGHLSERIDFRLLDAVAELGISLLLVGFAQRSKDFERLVARPNVRYVGPKPFEAMPSYLRAIDVGLTPYADTEFNRSSFPLKTLEYLAAGRLAVSTDLPAARWLNTDLVGIAREPSDFANVVDTFMRRPRSDKLVNECQAFARRHGWIERAHRFGEVLRLPEIAVTVSPRSASEHFNDVARA